MNFEILKCPYCGSEGNATREGELWYCSHCGLRFTDGGAEAAYLRLKENIASVMRGEMDEAARLAREEQYYNLRSNLWEKATAKYTDSTAIVAICREIKKLEPHDFLADFYETANSASRDEVIAFINGIDTEENGFYLDLVIDFMIRSLTSEYIAPIGYLIERAYRNCDLEKLEKYQSMLEREAKRVDQGIYETAIPRDVFIAYSSKDMPRVMRLCELLEENGLSCFVAMRNLQHGRDAKENYEAELHSAIDNCRIVVFVSSENSRSFSCDAIKRELTYIKAKDMLNAPAEYANNYAALPDKYKKPRVEYRLDNKKTLAADLFMKEFFAGKDYCESAEKVLLRVIELIAETEHPDTEEEERRRRDAADRLAREDSERRMREYLDRMQAELEAERKARLEAERRAEEARRAEEKKRAEASTPTSETGAKPSPVSNSDAAVSDRRAEEAEREARAEREREAKRIEQMKLRVYYACGIKDGVLTRFNDSSGEFSELTVPEDVTEIASAAFKNNTLIKKVVLPTGVTAIKEYAFKGCTELSEIVLPDTLTVIGRGAFDGCTSLVSLSLPDGVKIEDYAFSGCKSLAEVTLSGNVTAAAHSFEGCSGRGIIEAAIAKRQGEKKRAEDANLAESKRREDEEYMRSLFRIKDGKLTEFCDRENRIEEVIVPDGVTAIGYAAFSGKKKLRRVALPESLTVIEGVAFSGCTALSEISLPESVASIGSQAFDGCASLAEIKIPDGVVEIENSAFRGCTRLTKVTLPQSLRKIAARAFERCSSLADINIPKDVYSLGDFAFMGCDKLRETSLPERLHEINRAFSFNTGLRKIEIPASAEAIAERAFEGCSGLEFVDFASGVTSIGSFAFSECRALRSVRLPDTLQRIESCAFSDCTSLAAIDIPEEVEELGECAFDGCKALKRVTLPECITAIERQTFNGCTALEKISIPYGILRIGKEAFLGCTALTGVDMFSSVSKIEESAFDGCTKLADVFIPSSVVDIGERAFRNCKGPILSERKKPLFKPKPDTFANTWCESVREGVVWGAKKK